MPQEPTSTPRDAATAAVTADTEARYQIGEVADRTGVTQRTLRFYEEKGLLTPADRMEGGFRLYSEADIGRIRLIKQLQQLLGFSLAEIKEMVEAEETRATLRATRGDDGELGAEGAEALLEACALGLRVGDAVAAGGA